MNAEHAPDMFDDLATAHRILVNEKVLDAFGHVSLRDPAHPDRFWLASAKPPNLIGKDDLLSFGLSGEPVEKTDLPLYSERYIHSAIYAARPDVGAICHHHAPAIMPFCMTARPLAAVSQTGAFLGRATPLWDSADEFGDTRLLVDTPEQAASLARSLGAGSLVLMRGHGATVAGSSVREVVFKAVYACRDADALKEAAMLGVVTPLSMGEIEKGRAVAAAAVDRCWKYWQARLGVTAV
ncbi:MAG: class II aldolase/adducin family protein [Rhizobiales bacterium]|nr:class II aldolase/adducin family protein [Hyphomicrobiales bacterium]